MPAAPADVLDSDATPQARSPEKSQVGGGMSGTRLPAEAVEENAAQRSAGGGEIAGEPVLSATQGHGGPGEDVDPDEGADAED